MISTGMEVAVYFFVVAQDAVLTRLVKAATEHWAARSFFLPGCSSTNRAVCILISASNWLRQAPCPVRTLSKSMIQLPTDRSTTTPSVVAKQAPPDDWLNKMLSKVPGHVTRSERKKKKKKKGTEKNHVRRKADNNAAACLAGHTQRRPSRQTHRTHAPSVGEST